MCVQSGCLTSVALLMGLVQSLVWMGLSLAGGLVYLCVIPVEPYRERGDFLRVTLVKLYFEGPGCIPDGSYLGKLNEDYRNPKVLQLLLPDKVFGVMVTYFLLNVAYFFLSAKAWLNRKPHSAAEAKGLRQTLAGWSVLTVAISLIDAVFSERLVEDVISLQDYMGDKHAEHAEIFTSSGAGALSDAPYIPLALALLSSRFVGLWLWNVLIGLLLFLSALCGRSHPPKADRRPAPPPSRDAATSVSRPDAPDRCAMEAVTRFAAAPPNTVYPRDSWARAPWAPAKDWAAANEAYLDDDPQPDARRPDFDHDLTNFLQGRKKTAAVGEDRGRGG